MELDTQRLRDIPILTLFKRQRSQRVVNVLCPFHSEKTASLAIFPDNHFHCFGCGKHGKGAIDFVMAMGCDFKTACEQLSGLQ